MSDRKVLKTKSGAIVEVSEYLMFFPKFNRTFQLPLQTDLNNEEQLCGIASELEKLVLGYLEM